MMLGDNSNINNILEKCTSASFNIGSVSFRSLCPSLRLYHALNCVVQEAQLLVHTWLELNKNIKGSIGEGKGSVGKGRARLLYLNSFNLHQTQSGRYNQPL